KQAMNPQHPFASFATGNLDTLADRPDGNVRDELLDFYAKHYSADRMTLVLAGNYELDQLQQWAEQHFAAVPVRNSTPRQPNPPLFADGQLPLDLNIARKSTRLNSSHVKSSYAVFCLKQTSYT